MPDLNSFLGKNIDRICGNGFVAPDINHCAHFVAHALSLDLGHTCRKQMGGHKETRCRLARPGAVCRMSRSGRLAIAGKRQAGPCLRHRQGQCQARAEADGQRAQEACRHLFMRPHLSLQQRQGQGRCRYARGFPQEVQDHLSRPQSRHVVRHAAGLRPGPGRSRYQWSGSQQSGGSAHRQYARRSRRRRLHRSAPRPRQCQALAGQGRWRAGFPGRQGSAL